MDAKIEKDLIAIQKNFGTDRQESKLYEELNELLIAIDSGIKKDVIEEKADCFCLLFQEYLTNKQIQKAVVYKIERTQERIKSGYYEEVE